MRSNLLGSVFERLDAAGLRYGVLRGELDGPAPRGHRELDILLDPKHLPEFSRQVQSLGLVPMPVLGSGGHRFFTTYDAEAGEWLKLDVVTGLRFGGRGCLYTLPGAEQVLDRVPPGAPRMPDPADAVLILLVHCLLDKRAFKDEHRATLTALRHRVSTDPERSRAATERFSNALGGALGWPEAESAIARGDWAGLLVHRERVTAVLFRRDPVATLRRVFGELLRRAARPAHAVIVRRGFSVALIGPDGTGKSSLARLLAADPEIRGHIVYMGSNPKASTVGLWRGGATSFVPRLIEQSYRSAIGAFWKLRGHFVIYERHPWEGSNVASTGGLSGLRRALLLGACDRPDLVVVLDAPIDLLARRTPEHERERIEQQRARYRDLAGRLRGTAVVDTSDDTSWTIPGLTAAIWDGYRRHVAGVRGRA